jgi:hypothetical protein
LFPAMTVWPSIGALNKFPVEAAMMKASWEIV